MSKCISQHGEYSEHTLGEGDREFTCTLCWAFDEDACLAALANARSRPTAMRRQVTTREELDALPVGSVGRDADGYTFERFACLDYPGAKARWFMMCDDLPTGPDDIILPAIVLWRPDEDEVDGDEREVLVQVLDREGAQSGDCGHEPGELDECSCGDCRRILEGYADAILAAGFRRQGAVTVSRARVEALCRLLVDGGDMTPLASRWLLRLWGAS